MTVRVEQWVPQPATRLALLPLLRDSWTVRVALLFGLGLLYFGIYEHSQWIVRPGLYPQEVPRVPIPSGIWYSTGWLLFLASASAILSWPAPRALPGDLSARRLTVAMVATVVGVKILNRLAGIGLYGVEQHLSRDVLVGGALAALLLLAALLRWPPPFKLLFGGLLVAGLLVRLAFSALLPADPAYADNLVVIHLGLQHLLAGGMPYRLYELNGHWNPMPYLPWTFLSYLPGEVLGLSPRFTNAVLSLALILVTVRLITRLPIGTVERRSLLLVLAGTYVVPRVMGNDLYGELTPMNLALVATFGLLVIDRPRMAAAAYGVAVGAMPLTLYCAAPLLICVLRSRPWSEVLELAAITAGVALAPLVPFLVWDARAVWDSVSGDVGAVLQSDSTIAQTPWRLPWQYLPEVWLRLMDVGLFVVLTAFAIRRLRSTSSLLGCAIGSYAALVLGGPFIMPHFMEVVLYLAIIAQAVSLCTRLGQTQGAWSDAALARRDAPANSATVS